MCRKKVNTVAAFLLLGLSHYLLALPEDNKSLLTVHAGAADLNQNTHLGVYSGGVVLDQGSTHIRAAKARTQTNHKNQLIKAEIEGDKHTQAHYWTLPELGKPVLHAYADKMLYDPIQQRVELIGHARVRQGRHHMSSPILHYYIKTQHVVSMFKPGEQTTIVVHPEKRS